MLFKYETHGRINVAYLGEGEWINPITGEFETVNGVWCTCYECKFELDGITENWDGGTFYTKKQYAKHQKERRRAYFARKKEQAAKDGMARTKEITERMAVWEGRPLPTYFDIERGVWIAEESVSHQFTRLFGY